ncbi:GtrA family protein [Chloroflexota bacterium]
MKTGIKVWILDLAKHIISYVRYGKLTIGKFLIFSGSAVAINFLLLFLIVRYMGLDSQLGENVANAISMELSIIYNFFMSRAFTWSDRYKERRRKLFSQIVKFHLPIGITMVFRLVLFPVLQYLGVFYIINAAIGIALAAVFNFVIYDTIIFRKEV